MPPKNGAKLIPGDCITVMQSLPADSVDFIFVDPPYGHRNKSNDLLSRIDAALSLNPHNKKVWRPILNDNGPDADALFYNIAIEARRVLKHGAVFCCCCSGGGRDPHFQRWSQWLHEILEYTQTVIWDKGIGLGWHYRNSYETILVASKRGKFRWYDDSYKVENVIRHIPRVIPSRNDHPTPKPPELAEHFIRLHTRPGDCVLDPCMGGGSTGVAALRLGRRFVGIELDPHWYAHAEGKLLDRGE